MKPTALSVKLRRSARKLGCYIGGFISYSMPRRLFETRLPLNLGGFTPEQRAEIKNRAAYYCRLPEGSETDNSTSLAIGDYRFPWGRKKKLATYFFDLFSTLRHFDPSLRFSYIFGDVDWEPASPTFVKSRPIHYDGEPSMATLLRLNAARHYLFVPDHTPFRQKKDMIVSRNVVRQPHRRLFLEKWFGHPMVDAGQINSDCQQPGQERWIKPYMSIPDQLGYKFVCCIEGNDVATNLKWVMASNSVAVMPRPRFETWFMEGTLKPGVHYIEIAPDYSDLVEKLNHYISHPEEAEAIIENAHRYVARFSDSRVEKATSLLTAATYFSRTGQLGNLPKLTEPE